MCKVHDTPSIPASSHTKLAGKKGTHFFVQEVSLSFMHARLPSAILCVRACVCNSKKRMQDDA